MHTQRPGERGSSTRRARPGRGRSPAGRPVDRGRDVKLLVAPHDLSIGGSQINAIDLAAGAAEAGHDVVVYGVPGRSSSSSRPAASSSSPRARCSTAPRPRAIAQLAVARRAGELDLIHAYEWPPCLDAYYGAHLGARRAAALHRPVDVGLAARPALDPARSWAPRPSATRPGARTARRSGCSSRRSTPTATIPGSTAPAFRRDYRGRTRRAARRHASPGSRSTSSSTRSSRRSTRSTCSPAHPGPPRDRRRRAGGGRAEAPGRRGQPPLGTRGRELRRGALRIRGRPTPRPTSSSAWAARRSARCRSAGRWSSRASAASRAVRAGQPRLLPPPRVLGVEDPGWTRRSGSPPSSRRCSRDPRRCALSSVPSAGETVAERFSLVARRRAGSSRSTTRSWRAAGAGEPADAATAARRAAADRARQPRPAAQARRRRPSSRCWQGELAGDQRAHAERDRSRLAGQTLAGTASSSSARRTAGTTSSSPTGTWPSG